MLTPTMAERVLDSIGSPTCVLDGEGVIVAVNEAWRAFARSNGSATDEHLGIDYLAICRAAAADGVESAGRVAAGIAEVLAGARASFELDYTCHSPSERRWFGLRVMPTVGLPGAVVSHADVTALHLALERLEFAAVHDPMTGLHNRTLLGDRLAQILAHDRTSGDDGLVAVINLDLDRFRAVNDAWGSREGDAVIRAVAERFRGSVRFGDTLARAGGDEFIIIAPVEAIERGVAFAERLRDVLREPVQADLGCHRITASIGIVIARHGDDGEDVLRAARGALTEAKRQGGDRVQLATEESSQRTMTRAGLEADLQGADQRGEFEFHYQPVVDLGTGVPRGVEALVRWVHPERGHVPPLDFVPLIEDSGLIVPLGGQWLDTITRQAAGWRASVPLDVAVNISARQLTSGRVLEQVQHALEASELPAQRLVVEVTESVLAADAATAIATVRALREQGIRIAIDDFGTGYSTFLAIKDYPVDILKIDRSFVAGMIAQPSDRAIVTSVLHLAADLGVSVIAEGVETHEQRRFLLEHGCRYAQGYFFARPTPEKLLVPLIDYLATGAPTGGEFSGGRSAPA